MKKYLFAVRRIEDWCWRRKRRFIKMGTDRAVGTCRPYGSRAKWRLDRGNEADDQKSRRVEYRHRLF